MATLRQRVVWRSRQANLPRYLYHVTFLHALESIQSRGLRPGSGQTFGGGYGGHSRGRVFFTEDDGVNFWFDRYEMNAPNMTDTPEEGWVPVVLRVASSKIHPAMIDEAGTRDASAQAFYIEKGVASNDLEVYDGRSWKRLSSADPDAMLERVLAASEQEFDEDTGESWWYMAEDFFKP